MYRQSEYITGRLVLKILDESHAPAVVDYYRRNAAFLQEWDQVREDAFYTLEYHRRQLRYERGEMETGRLLRLWLLVKADPVQERVIGTVAFNNIVRGAFLSCHLGYRLDKDEVNKGYATEAVGRGIAVMFEEYGLHRIEANIMPKNKPSLRVVEKLGFCAEGLARKYLKINGCWEDHLHMVLLNDKV